jgi:hypothetical protein
MSGLRQGQGTNLPGDYDDGDDDGAPVQEGASEFERHIGGAASAPTGAGKTGTAAKTGGAGSGGGGGGSAY